MCANSLTGVYNTNSYLVPDLCWIFFSLNVANYLKYVPLSSFSVADFLSKKDDEKNCSKKLALEMGGHKINSNSVHFKTRYIDNGYSSNKIRKTQNEHLNIACQNLNSQKL